MRGLSLREEEKQSKSLSYRCEFLELGMQKCISCVVALETEN